MDKTMPLTEDNVINTNKAIDLEYYWKKKTVISFVLSIFVVLIHMSSFSQYTYQGTIYYSVINFFDLFFRRTFVLSAVPMFFIMSGATFFRNYKSYQYKSKLISKSKTLLIPYICWNVLNLLFVIATSYSFISNYFIGRQKFIITLPNVLLSILF